MTNTTDGQEETRRTLSREEILAVIDVKPVFEIATREAGTIDVTSFRANTLERIAGEFGRDDSDDAKLRSLLGQVGQKRNDEGQLTRVPASLVSRVTSDELVDFARKFLVSEDWASEDEAASELDPKKRLVEAVRAEIEAAEVSYRKLLDALGPSISETTRASIANASRLADKLRLDIANSPAVRAMEALRADRAVGQIATLAKMQSSVLSGAGMREHASRLDDSLRTSEASPQSPRIDSIPTFVSPAIESAKATAESAAKMEQTLGRLEQRADDSALLIAGIHDVVRNMALDMAKGAQESSAATQKSLDQATASVTWAKYALMASVVIGFVGLVFAGVSAWYAVYPASLAQPQEPATAAHASPNVELHVPDHVTARADGVAHPH